MANEIVRFTTGLNSDVNKTSNPKQKGKVMFAITEDNKGYIYFDKDNNTRIKMSEHALTAEKDAANNTITSTYLKQIAQNESTSAIFSIKSLDGNGTTKNVVTIPNASTSIAGLVSATNQTFGGNKTFNDEVIVKKMLTAEADIISANGYPYIKKKTFTGIIATANNTSNGCFYLANIRPDNFYEPWNFRVFVHVYVPGHPEYNGLYDITVTGYYAISSNVKYWNVVYSNFNAMNTSYRPIYYSGLRTLNETGYNANSPILWGVDLYASTNPTAAGYERTVEVVLIDTENCTFDFRDTPIKHADVTNTSHYYTNYSMDCCNNGLRESSDNDTYDRTYATNYVRVGSSPIHRYSLIMQDTTDGFSSLVYKTKNSNNNDNAASGHVAATDVHFIPTGQILWNSTGSWYNTTGNQTGSIGMYTAIPLDFRYASNCSSGLTIGKPVYYIFNKNVDDNTLSIDNAIHTQTLPTTEDGKVYMFLGIAYATTHIYLHHVHPMYEFIDGKLRSYRETIPVKQGGTGKTSWIANRLLYASDSNTLSQVNLGVEGQVLLSGENGIPQWGNQSDLVVDKAEKDGAGNVITTNYIKHGSISVSDTNHNMTYTNGANGDTKTVSLPFVKLSGDTMTGNLTTSGDMTAVNFIGHLTGNADSASTLTHKTVDSTTLHNTAGSFAFSGNGVPWSGDDYVGLQIGDSADKFQITGSGKSILFRQNDNGGTNTTWGDWHILGWTTRNTQVGSTTQPVYMKNDGEISPCTYSLKATVNNATKFGVAYYSETTSITSTAAGAANTALMGKGSSAAPAFVSVTPTLTLTGGTTAGPKIKINVLGVDGSEITLPTASSTASGIVTTDSQTFLGTKTFTNPIVINAAGDSSHSTFNAASIVTSGGVSVAKNLSAKSIRIDNNKTDEGVSLQYDETLDTLNFVFV